GVRGHSEVQIEVPDRKGRCEIRARQPRRSSVERTAHARRTIVPVEGRSQCGRIILRCNETPDCGAWYHPCADLTVGRGLVYTSRPHTRGELRNQALYR